MFRPISNNVGVDPKQKYLQVNCCIIHIWVGAGLNDETRPMHDATLQWQRAYDF